MSPTGRKSDGTKAQVGLANAAALLPTVTTADASGGPGTSGREGGVNLRTAAGGALNPRWVEWLMGWPDGWTASEPVATAPFQSWLDSHSALCFGALAWTDEVAADPPQVKP